MGSLAGVVTGDEVMVYRTHRRGSVRAKVTKVARKYLYVEGEQDGFDIETGSCKDGYGHAQTVEAFERNQAAEKARTELYNFGVKLEPFMAASKVMMIYEALKPVLLPGTGEKP